MLKVSCITHENLILLSELIVSLIKKGVNIVGRTAYSIYTLREEATTYVKHTYLIEII